MLPGVTTGSISGTVTDADTGTPIEGATVSVEVNGTAKEATTDVAGAYSIEEVPAGLNFSSTAYEWLVIANHRAQFKGSGTINGSGTYSFMLTAIDGNLTNSQDYDSFRIKIWDEDEVIIYDNQMGKSDTGDNATELGGGSIVIHSGAQGRGR